MDLYQGDCSRYNGVEERATLTITDAPYQLLSVVAACYVALERSVGQDFQKSQAINEQIIACLGEVYHWGEKLRPHSQHPGLQEHFAYVTGTTKRLQHAHTLINTWTENRKLCTLVLLGEGVWQRCLRQMMALGFEDQRLEALFVASQGRCSNVQEFLDLLMAQKEEIDNQFAIPVSLGESHE